MSSGFRKVKKLQVEKLAEQFKEVGLYFLFCVVVCVYVVLTYISFNVSIWIRFCFT